MTAMQTASMTLAQTQKVAQATLPAQRRNKLRRKGNGRKGPDLRFALFSGPFPSVLHIGARNGLLGKKSMAAIHVKPTGSGERARLAKDMLTVTHLDLLPTYP
jgi:hypothetical protein